MKILTRDLIDNIARVLNTEQCYLTPQVADRTAEELKQAKAVVLLAEGDIAVNGFEAERLKSVEDTWSAIFYQLGKGNPEWCHMPNKSGRECALAEIERLQTRLMEQERRIFQLGTDAAALLEALAVEQENAAKFTRARDLTEAARNLLGQVSDL